MKKWVHTGDCMPAYDREVLVYSSESKKFKICYCDHYSNANNDSEKWKSRNSEFINAFYWREFPNRP